MRDWILERAYFFDRKETRKERASAREREREGGREEKTKNVTEAKEIILEETIIE